MDLLKLISSLEDLIVEIALWIILLPRTLFAAVVTPVSLARYFDGIQSIPVEERDDEYLSPVLFWLLLAPVSLLVFFMRQDQATFALYGSDADERIATAVLMLLGPPLGFALASVLSRRERFSKSSLGRQFKLQCYFHAPLAVVTALSFYFTKRFGENAATSEFLIGSIWFFVAEYRVARRDSEVGRAIYLVALGCGFAFVLIFAIGFAVAVSFVFRGRLPALR